MASVGGSSGVGGSPLRTFPRIEEVPDEGAAPSADDDNVIAVEHEVADGGEPAEPDYDEVSPLDIAETINIVSLEAFEHGYVATIKAAGKNYKLEITNLTGDANQQKIQATEYLANNVARIIIVGLAHGLGANAEVTAIDFTGLEESLKYKFGSHQYTPYNSTKNADYVENHLKEFFARPGNKDKLNAVYKNIPAGARYIDHFYSQTPETYSTHPDVQDELRKIKWLKDAKEVDDLWRLKVAELTQGLERARTAPTARLTAVEEERTVGERVKDSISSVFRGIGGAFISASAALSRGAGEVLPNGDGDEVEGEADGSHSDSDEHIVDESGSGSVDES